MFLLPFFLFLLQLLRLFFLLLFIFLIFSFFEVLLLDLRFLVLSLLLELLLFLQFLPSDSFLQNVLLLELSAEDLVKLLLRKELLLPLEFVILFHLFKDRKLTVIILKLQDFFGASRIRGVVVLLHIGQSFLVVSHNITLSEILRDILRGPNIAFCQHYLACIECSGHLYLLLRCLERWLHLWLWDLDLTPRTPGS